MKTMPSAIATADVDPSAPAVPPLQSPALSAPSWRNDPERKYAADRRASVIADRQSLYSLIVTSNRTVIGGRRIVPAEQTAALEALDAQLAEHDRLETLDRETARAAVAPRLAAALNAVFPEYINALERLLAIAPAAGTLATVLADDFPGPQPGVDSNVDNRLLTDYVDTHVSRPIALSERTLADLRRVLDLMKGAE